MEKMKPGSSALNEIRNESQTEAKKDPLNHQGPEDIFESFPKSKLQAKLQEPLIFQQIGALKLKETVQNKYPKLQSLVDEAQKEEVLFNGKKHEKNIDRIYAELSKNQTPESLKLFSQIREVLIKFRARAVLKQKVTKFQKPEEQQLLEQSANVEKLDLVKPAAVTPSLPEPSKTDEKLKRELIEFVNKIVNGKAEGSFQQALKNISVQRFNELNRNQLIALYHVSQNDVLKNDAMRQILIGNIDKEFPKKFRILNLLGVDPIEELKKQVNEKAARLKKEDEEEGEPVQHMPPTRPATPPLDTFERQLAALKKSRVIPYEILEPHENLLREKPDLIEKLNSVRRTNDQFPKGFIESLPAEIQKSITDWFSKSKADRAKELREIVKKRGEQVRVQTVMPSEIAKFLKASGIQIKVSLKKYVDFDSLSKALARMILDAVENPEKYQKGAYGVKLLKREEEFIFPVFGPENNLVETETIKFPVDLWVKPQFTGDNLRNIEFQMIAEPLGSGTYKTVKASTQLNIGLSDSQHPKNIEKNVLVVSKNDNSDLILEPLKLVQENFAEEIKSGKVRFAGLLTQTERKNQGNFMEATDAYYSGDLEQRKDLSFQEKMAVLGDAAKTYLAMHEKGFIHGDVKPPNIMVDKQKQGLVGDFDFTSKFGMSDTKSEYRYWDNLRQEGYGTPFTDAYGLAKATIESALKISVWNGQNISDHTLIGSLQSQKIDPDEPQWLRGLLIKVLKTNAGLGPTDFNLTVEQLQEKYSVFGEFLNAMAKYARKD